MDFYSDREKMETISTFVQKEMSSDGGNLFCF